MLIASNLRSRTFTSLVFRKNKCSIVQVSESVQGFDDKPGNGDGGIVTIVTAYRPRRDLLIEVPGNCFVR